MSGREEAVRLFDLPPDEGCRDLLDLACGHGAEVAAEWSGERIHCATCREPHVVVRRIFGCAQEAQVAP